MAEYKGFPLLVRGDMNLENFMKSAERAVRESEEPEMFQDMNATALYCPRCKEAVPVRKHLLLILPEGEKYEYRCAFCAESVGTQINRLESPVKVIL
jgi:hypothetical protein